MHSLTELPAGYRPYAHIDLQKDKKTALFVNAAAIVAAVILIIGMEFLVPFATLILDGGFLLKWLVMLVSILAYLVLHELTHGAAMRFYGAKKLRFGFTGLYAYCGSEYDYFDKAAYRLIALAPLAVWGIIFTVLCIAVPRGWFWIAYLLQVINITGAAGDIYVTIRCAKMPADLLVMDTGVEMTVFSKKLSSQAKYAG